MQLTRQTLGAFLALSKPFGRDVRDTPLPRHEADEEKVRISEAAIRGILSLPTGGWPVDALFHLRKNVEIAVHLGEASPKQWLLLYAVFDALRGSDRCRSLDDRVAWCDALGHALDAVNSHWFRHDMISGSREEAVADALRRLRRKGFDARVDGLGSRLVPSHLLRLCARIEKRIQEVGGLRAANAMLELMHRNGRVRDGSLIHARTPDMLSRRQVETGTPWHFLYSLMIKHLGRPGRHGSVTDAMDSMIELARLLAAAIDVEPHNSYENMNIGDASIAKVLNDTLIYDEMFAFPQWQPISAESLVHRWFAALKAEGCDFPLAPANVWSAFADRLMIRAQPNVLVPVTGTLLACADVPYSDAERLVEACCPSPTGSNAAYRTPEHTGARTAIYYPVLPAANGTRVAQPRGIAARALCERLYALMREGSVPDLENRMGRALERLTAGILEAAGHAASIKNGCYANPQGRGDLEIDLAVETPDRVFLFECKKKPLTNAARRGETLAALGDLDKSFLYLVQQVAQHEAVLRSQGEIRFRDGSILSLDGRSVEKFCIGLFDHGSLQHRDMTMAMLDLFVGKRIRIDDPSAAELEKSINDRLDRIGRSLRTIVDHQDGEDDQLFHAFAMSTWWLSVDQLQYAVIKGGDLWSGIERVRHLTRRSGDLIYDMLTTVDLNEVGEALFALNKQMDNRSML